MLIDIRTIGFELTDATRGYAEERVESALGWASHWIEHVSIWLWRAAGEEMACRMAVCLRLDRNVVVESAHADHHVAINSAATELRESVLREVRRHLARRKHVRHGLRPSYA